MKTKFMKITAWLLTLIMLITTLTSLGLTAFAAEGDTGTTNIWVGGVKVTESNAADVLGDSTVSYDAETNTLTLNGADLAAGYEYKTDRIAGIYADGDLNIELDGAESKITAPDAASLSHGIRVLGELYISGSGTLTATGGTVTATDSVADSVGIFATGQISIVEVNVIATGGSATVNGNGTAYSNGIYLKNGLDLDFDGGLLATGGTVRGMYAYSSGIDAYGSEDNYINLSIRDGYLEAAGGKAVGVLEAGSNGVYVNNGGFYVYETGAQVILTAAAVEVTSSEEDDRPYAYSNGIYLYAGDVGIEAGSVNISGGSYSGLYGDAIAAYVDADMLYDDDGEEIGLSGGYMTIGCDEVKMSSHGPWLEGTKVTITAPDGYAIYAEGGVDIDEKLIISAPEGGKIDGIGGSTDPENWVEPDYWTIFDEDGDEAKSVTIEPQGYTVTIRGLNNGMAALVPAGQSLNEAYCEMYEVEDFSEILNTEKDGYTFGGWYTDEACTAGNEFDFDSPVNADITIYAKWVPVYVPSVEETEGGDVTVNPEAAEKGETVVIIPKPDDGKEVDTVTVTDKDGNSITVTKNNDGTYSFAQPEGDVTVKVTYKDKQSSTTGGDTGKDDNKPSGNPQTGDNCNIALWIALLFVSGGAIITLTVYDRKRRKATQN